MKLSERQTLFLRLIATGGEGGWSPGDRWVEVLILDGMLPKTIIVGGGSDVNAILALERRGLITRPLTHIIKYHCCITEEGKVEVEKLKKSAK